MDPIECAITGDLEYFKTAELDTLLTARSPDHADSVLCVAAMNSHFTCCQEILKRCPTLLYTTSTYKSTALHRASYNKAPDIVKLLVDAGGEKLLTMASYHDLTALHFAVQKDDVESVKVLVEADKDGKLLRMVNTHGNTGMHLAVKRKNWGVVKVLMEADPGIEYGVNGDGHTPVFIAFEEALAGEETAVNIRKKLLQNQPSQSEVQVGDKGWTLLHHATYHGNISTVEEIVRFWPCCLEVVDNDGRNVLHLALTSEHFNVARYYLGLLTVPDNVLNGKDCDGNTPLHIAALGGNKDMIISLLYDPRVMKLIQNVHGQKAIDSINFDYDKRKAGVYGVTDRVNEKEIKEQTDYDLLVGALIAAVTFTAGIAVPGGYISEGPRKGTAVLATKFPFKIFMISNNIALLLSLYVVFSHFCTKHLQKKEDIIYQLNVATFCTLGAIFALVLAFIMGTCAVLAFTYEVAITICVSCGCFFFFAFYTMSKMVIQRMRSFR